MGEAYDLKCEQRRVRRGALPALAFAIVLFLAVGSGGDPVPLAQAARYAVCAMLAPALCVVAAVGGVANRRFFSSVDIGAATTRERSEPVTIARAILLNTLEQAFLAVTLYAALALLLPDPRWLLVSLATMFVVGRIFFAFGYRRGAGGRAFGFGLTFYPNAIGLVYTTVVALRDAA